MARTEARSASVHYADDGAAGRRWVEVFADHVRRRFNSRAVVSVRIDGKPVELAYVYALEGGGLVLTLPSEHEHEHRPEEARGLWSGSLGTGESEIWIRSPDQVVFEARRIEVGVPCTGFGYLGLSRTPRVIVPRATEPPPTRDHHEHGDF